MSRTIQTTLSVGSGGAATLRVPADIPPGEHRAVVMIEEGAEQKNGRPPLILSRYDVEMTNPAETFRREDIYGDDGR